MPQTTEERFYNLALENAFKSDIDGKTLLSEKEVILKHLKSQIGEKLYHRIVKKYHLDHLSNPQENLYLSDLRGILVGIVTNVTFEDCVENESLVKFIDTHQTQAREMAKTERQVLAKTMDEYVLKHKNLFVKFGLRIGKAIANATIKAGDLKDAFAGVQINAAFEEDIKTVATLEYSHTYQNSEILNSEPLKRVVHNIDERKKLASGLYLASDLAYRNLNHGSMIPVLDEEGFEKLYRVHNIANEKGIVCTALVPYDRPCDIKILFRGTHSVATALADLESTGAGCKSMRDHRIMLLDEVNALVSDLQKKVGDKKVSLSVHGHSLGGSLAERFTSELHQAIYYQNLPNKHKRLTDNTIRDLLKKSKITWSESSETKAIKHFRERLALNYEEMEGRDYSALDKLSHINTTGANSARLSRKEAHMGEIFIAFTQEQKGPQQGFYYFKSKGDPVAQAGFQSLGASFADKSSVKVSVLQKDGGYGQFTSMDPILGHCDHPLMRYHDKKNDKPVSFEFDNNSTLNRYARLRKKLISGKAVPKKIQNLYSKVPTPIVEPNSAKSSRLEAKESETARKRPRKK